MIRTNRENTPLLLCRTDGTVIAKNPAAGRVLRGFRQGMNVCRHLLPREREAFTAGLTEEGMVLHFPLPGSFHNAYAVQVRWQGEAYALLMFLVFLQADPKDSVEPWLERTMRRRGGVFAALFPQLISLSAGQKL